MSEILFQYQKVGPTMWAYLSSLLIIGLYFKFNRFWSVRNLDLCLVILLAPGLLFVYYGEQLSRKPVVAGATPPAAASVPANAPPPAATENPTNDSSSTDAPEEKPPAAVDPVAGTADEKPAAA